MSDPSAASNSVKVDTVSSLPFSIASVYIIRNVKEDPEVLALGHISLTSIVLVKLILQ